MVGRVGYAPTTPAMSMQYSTIELTALNNYLLILIRKIFESSILMHIIIERLIAKIVRLKSEKKAPLGIIGIKYNN
jgi:hypothetical protein